MYTTLLYRHALETDLFPAREYVNMATYLLEDIDELLDLFTDRDIGHRDR